jgi:threonine/homoserine/homoserine lactone efflux protein
MDIATVAAFAAAFLVFAASPGPDNVTIVARTVSHGARYGIAYGAGTVTGILIFLALSVFGLSIIASEMGALMAVLRYAGAAYLIWMGVRLWIAKPVPAQCHANAGYNGVAGSFAAGVILNLGNPKMPLFYLALLPNVVGADLAPEEAVILMLVILLIEAVVIGSHVVMASRARSALRNPLIIRRVNRTSGVVMVGAGLAVAVTR